MRRFVTRLLIALACTAFSFFLYRNVHAAAVFDNSASSTYNIEYNPAFTGPPFNKYHVPTSTFTSSTLQLELTDLTMFCVYGGGPTTQTHTLFVSTDKGEWSVATTTHFAMPGEAVTWLFPWNGHPVATPGTDWDFWVIASDTPGEMNCYTTSTKSGFAAASTLYCDGAGTSCTTHQDVYAAGYAPALRINGSGLGALTLTVPDQANYSFTTSTATGQDFGLFGNMFRDVFEWLFVPSGYGMAANLSEVKDLLTVKFPFSYVAGLQADITESMVQTSTTEIGLTLNFSEMVATSTSSMNFMGAWPATTTLFSASTTQSYGTSGIFAFLRFLVGLALWVGLAETIYYGARNLFKYQA